MPDPTRLVEVLERFASTMAGTSDPVDVFDQLCASTMNVLSASGAGVCVANAHGQLLHFVATDDGVAEVERVQERTQAGPGADAFRDGELVTVGDLELDRVDGVDGVDGAGGGDGVDRWGEFRRAARRRGFGSVVGLPLRSGDRRLGSLDVYDTSARRWDDAELRAARALADVASTHVVRSGELAEARELTSQLQHALEARVVIEQAKGVLSRHHGVSMDEAFSLLRDSSRRRSVPLRTIAEGVVSDGLIAPPTAD